MKIMISIPMNNVPESEWKTKFLQVSEMLKRQGYEVVDSLITDDPSDDINNVPLWYLAKSLESMSKCSAVFFCTGWEKARGCIVEHLAANQYGLTLLYE